MPVMLKLPAINERTADVTANAANESSAVYFTGSAYPCSFFTEAKNLSGVMRTLLIFSIIAAILFECLDIYKYFSVLRTLKSVDCIYSYNG